jgi:Cu2+-exporting ATPase
MHPQVLKDEPGKCPLCGMALVPVGGSSVSHVQKSGHGHSGHSQHNHAEKTLINMRDIIQAISSLVFG